MVISKYNIGLMSDNKNRKFKVIYFDLDKRTEYYDDKKEALSDINQVTMIAAKANRIPKIAFLEFDGTRYVNVGVIPRQLTEQEKELRRNLPSIPSRNFVTKCPVCDSTDIKWVDSTKIALIDKQLWLDQKGALGIDRLLKGCAWICLRCNQLEVLI